jgi:hypothetical protein
VSASNRRDRVTRSSELGTYVEFREPWRRSLFVIGFWLGVGVLLAISLGSGSATDCSLVPVSLSACRETALDNLEVSSLLAILCFAAAAIFTWRRLFRRPGLVLGEFGFENRTQVFSVRRVRWHDVRMVYPSRRHLFWRTMDIGLTRSPVRQGRPTFDRVRLSGLSQTPGEIEAEISKRFERAHGEQELLAHSRIVDGDRILHGIRVIAEDDQTYPDISSGRLYELLARMEPGDSVVMETRGLRNEDQSIKASRAGDGSWQVDYRIGEDDHRDECGDAATLHHVLVRWADGVPDWLDGAG